MNFWVLGLTQLQVAWTEMESVPDDLLSQARVMAGSRNRLGCF